MREIFLKKTKGWAAPLALVLLAGFALSSCSRENPHVKSGREKLTAGELSDAIKEFKAALEANPKDPKAKALLYYAQARKGRDINSFSALLGVYMCSEAQKDKLVGEAEVEKLKLELRNEFYQAGLETADWKELARIAAIAGREAFAQPDPEKDDYFLVSFKMVGAAVAAKEGNPEGIRYLLKGMKDYQDENIYLYLFAYQALGSVGKPALRTLREEAGNRESLLAESAERTLTLLDAVSKLTAFKQAAPGARSLRVGDVAEEIYDDYFGSVATIIPASGAYYFGDYTLAVELPHLESLESDDSLKPGNMLFIYGIDPTHAGEEFFAAFYRWDEQALGWTPVKLQDAKGKKMDSYWARTPVVEFEETDDGFALFTATVEERTVYKSQWDWNTYSTRRVPTTRNVVALEAVNLLYANNMLTVTPAEPVPED